MSMPQYIKDMIPYNWKKTILDIVKPKRQGMGPVLRRMNRDMTTIFDIGANAGDISLYMLYYFRKAAVYSFEPCSETYETLLKNIEKAGYGERNHPYRLGFLDKEIEGILNITSFHGANSMLDISSEYHRANPHLENIKTESIPLMRLDDFVERNQINHIDLIKIDVEGVEQQILRGGKETFSTKVDTVIIEISFVRHPAASGEFIKLFQLMHDYGFIPCHIYDIAQSDKGEMSLAQFDCVFCRY